MPYGGWMKSRKNYGTRVPRNRRRRRIFRVKRLNWSLNKRTKIGRLKNMVGFPSTNIVKMRYADSFDADMSTSAIIINQVRANSIYQPEVVTGPNSHRPLGYDQWAQFYERYVVLGSRIRITAVNNNVVTDLYILGVWTSDSDGGSAGSVLDLIEQGNSMYQQVSPANNGFIANQSVIGKYSAKKFHNVTDVADADTLEAAFNANPADVTYFNIFLGPADGLPASSPAHMSIQYTIDYIVLLKDPRELIRSDL